VAHFGGSDLPARATHTTPHTPHEALIAKLRARIDATLRPMLHATRSAALLDFPSHSNVGDSAIWLGELAYLRSLGGVSLAYTCDARSYSRGELAKRLGSGIILLSGGGNLGDLWEEPQQLRERVIKDFPDTRIVQLPQSIHFQSQRALLRAREIFDSHSRLTLLVRDRQSLTFARNEFRNPSHLCPDMAFCLGPLKRPRVKAEKIVWLSRTDKESAGPNQSTLGTDIEPVDWLDEPVTALRTLNKMLDGRLMRYARGASGFNRVRSRVWEQLAHQRLSRGCRLLSAGRTVLTDRLHGHVLSVLLGIPHLLLDNSTGKVRSFYETWTSSLPHVRWCSTPVEALALATTVIDPEAAGSRTRANPGNEG
jgi:exopolysaccharide biosynthesis predicted pyruvyltransferase EpsI